MTALPTDIERERRRGQKFRSTLDLATVELAEHAQVPDLDGFGEQFVNMVAGRFDGTLPERLARARAS